MPSCSHKKKSENLKEEKEREKNYSHGLYWIIADDHQWFLFIYIWYDAAHDFVMDYK